MKLKDCKTCQCFYTGDGELIPGRCRFGYCVIMKCPWCNMISMEWGPVFCPHKKNENGIHRQLIYPDMAPVETHWGRKGMRKPRRSHK